MMFEGMEFAPLQAADIEVLTPVMKRAFDDDSRRYFDRPTGGPEGYDDGSFLKKWGLDASSAAYRVNLNGQAVGAVIVFLRPECEEGFLGCIFVDSVCAGQGLGTVIWRFIEQRYPEIRVWQTETPAVSYRNHCFYVNKLGFHIVAVDGGRDDRYEAQFRLVKDLRKKGDAR